MILDLIYWELTLGLVVITGIINNAFGIKYIVHPKWLVLVLWAFGSIVHGLTHETTEFWRLVTSLGCAVIVYNYIVSPIRDAIKRKNPLY